MRTVGSGGNRPSGSGAPCVGVLGWGVCWFWCSGALWVGVRCGVRVSLLWGCSWAGPGGRPLCGVCGLLFENCIVDASIF